MKLTYCLIASVFMGASILTMLKCDSCGPFQVYLDSLDDNQKKVYDDIKSERRNIYLRGLALGSVVALIYLYFNKDTLNVFKHACTFVGIAMTIQYFVYQLCPKTNWMLNSLQTREQLDSWLEVYKHMKNKYHSGLVLGALSYGLFSYGFLSE